ncbi:tRNA nucleotidyltransferase/poly(A) polymerase [Elusimicrobium posterum]|uniref:CCA tRNA nucleotidyltransferase n=1 Tax=Elusimicrobium posterum TaxID=3116653 RepID=UPI003C71CA29
MIKKSTEALLKEIGVQAQKLNLKTWAVGGCVRDFYLNKDTQDIDIAVEGPAAELVDFCIKKWGGKKESFSTFGTYRVNLDNGVKLDFVRCRSEVYPQPAALPVVQPATIKEDLYRRDFTANAWAMSILPANFGEGYDPYDAEKDINKKQIKILHEKSFLDDPTRMFRAVRFAGRFGWKMEKETEKLLKTAVAENYPHMLSKERIRQEFIKILQEKEIKRIFALLKKYDLIKFIFPGLKYNAALEKTQDVNVRTGILMLGLKKEGRFLLEDLRLARNVTQELECVFEIQNTKMSPLKELSKTQKDILNLFNPKLPPSAVHTPFLTGADIMNLGLKGKDISNAQKKLRALQFKGKINNKTEAAKEVTKWIK